MTRRFRWAAVALVVASCAPPTGPYSRRVGHYAEYGRYWRGLRDGTWSADADNGRRLLWRVTYRRGLREGKCWMRLWGDGFIEGNYHEDRRHGAWREVVATDCSEGAEQWDSEGFHRMDEQCSGRFSIRGRYVAGVRDGRWHLGAAIVVFRRGRPEVSEARPPTGSAVLFGQAAPGTVVAVGDRVTVANADGRFRLEGVVAGWQTIIYADGTGWNFNHVDVGSASELDVGTLVVHDVTTDCPASRPPS